jgi:hypothetical protein
MFAFGSRETANVVEIARLETVAGEAPRGSQLREADAVLHAVEALLLRRRDECPVDEECRRRVAVKGVEAANCG